MSAAGSELIILSLSSSGADGLVDSSGFVQFLYVYSYLLIKAQVCGIVREVQSGGGGRHSNQSLEERSKLEI